MNLKKILITLLFGVGVLALSFVIVKSISSTVVVTRSFNTNLEKAWFIWYNVGSIERWWGTKDASINSIENDFRVDGQFLFTTQSAGGFALSLTGKYSEIIPNQKIVSSFLFAEASGQVLETSKIPLPGKWRPGILKVEFKEVGTKIQIKITQTGVPLLMKPVAQWMWNQQLDKYFELIK